MVFTEQSLSKCLSSLNELNAILFFQTNFGLACEIADKIKQKFQQEEVIIIDFQDDEKSFIQKLQNELCDGFFSTKKLIKVYNFKPNGKSKIKDELKLLNEQKYTDKLILFFAPELDGKSAIKTLFEKGDFTASIACYDDDEKTASEYIIKYCNENNLPIKTQKKKMISEMLHGDRFLLKGELDKLLMLYGNEHLITEDDVDNSIETLQEFDATALADNILTGNTTQAIKIFDLLKSGEETDKNVINIVRSLYYIFNRLLQTKQSIENNTTSIEEATKFTFWKRKATEQKILSTLTSKHFENYIKKIFEIEKSAKKYGNDIALRLFEKNIILKV